MMQRNSVLRVNEAEEAEDYLEAVAETLRRILSDHRTTLHAVAEKVGISLGTISNASNKKATLNAIFLNRLGRAYGSHYLDPYAKLSGGRMVPLEDVDGGDVLPVMTLTTARIAAARSPSSPGGTSETLREQLGYLPELRRLQREVGALICRIEERKDAA